MKNYTIIGLVLLSGCCSVQAPRNATLKTADGPLVQAHRGGRFEYDDNAAGGFTRCLEKGIRGFETDVRFSKDHELVIMHDGNADRTSDGKGYIETLTLAELKKFRLKASSEPIPTAVEVMQTLGKRDDVFIELEMKAYPGAFYTPEVLTEYCRKLNAAAKENLAPGTYAFTCFNTNTLATMHAVDPGAPLGYIVGGWLRDEHIATAKAHGCCSVAPMLGTAKEMVDKAHAAGLTVCLWMVQNAEDYAQAKEKGADRVTSDYPSLVDCAARGKR